MRLSVFFINIRQDENGHLGFLFRFPEDCGMPVNKWVFENRDFAPRGLPVILKAYVNENKIY